VSTDFGKSCEENNGVCTLHNLHCAYPDCKKGRDEKHRKQAQTHDDNKELVEIVARASFTNWRDNATAKGLHMLADRCEREEPSHNLNCSIGCAVDAEPGVMPPAYTTSLDAAVRPEGDDVFWRSGHDGEGPDPSLFKAEVLLSDHARVFIGRARTEPMARRAAELRARAALSQTEEAK
jgi:hypothetical protein